MATWAEMTADSPSVAKLGQLLLVKAGRGFLATTRADGGPRVQAVCPVLRGGRLYIGLIRSTPKCKDLQRDPRFALHAPLGEGDTEFWLTGVARPLAPDRATELLAPEPKWQLVAGGNALFHLDIRTAYGTIFRPGPHNDPVPDRRSFRARQD
jgi:hypothetical protein